MIWTRRIGQHYENQAKQYLITQGLTPICENFACRDGEIDLIMRDGDSLVFIEVRYRKSLRFGHPIETVTANKQHKILRTAQYFLLKHKQFQPYNLRFDIIGISQSEPPILWVKHAFSE